MTSDMGQSDMIDIVDKAPEAQEAAPAAAPEPLLRGSFALFQHQGGYLIAWKKKGESATRHLPLPAMIINMAAQMSGKTPEEVIAEFSASVGS